MNKKPILFIYEQIEPKPLTSNQFRIVENCRTIDGLRSRVTDKSFPSMEEAKQFVENYYEQDQN